MNLTNNGVLSTQVGSLAGAAQGVEAQASLCASLSGKIFSLLYVHVIYRVLKSINAFIFLGGPAK